MTQRIYLDYNGTCPMDDDVRSAVANALRAYWENPSSSRGGGKAAKAAVEEARRLVAGLINASPEEIVFTSGGTEANNMVIYSAIEEFRRFLSERCCDDIEGNGGFEQIPHIITTNIEHDSVAELLTHLEAKKLCYVTRIPVDTPTGFISEFAVLDAIQPNTCLITIMMANNETGVMQPVIEISENLREINRIRSPKSYPTIRLHTDAAQVIGKLRVDVNDGGIDYLTIVGHKFYGPRNGALYVRHGAPIYPMFFGGGQERNIRPGTENTPMIVGLGKAADIAKEKLQDFTVHMKEMRNYLEIRLMETFGQDVVINFTSSGDHYRLPNTSSVSFKMLPGTASDLLASCHRLVASTGAACHSDVISPSAVLLACGIPEELALRTIRFSVGRQTTRVEIDEVIKELVGLIEDSDSQ